MPRYLTTSFFFIALTAQTASHAGEIDLTITGFADDSGAARIVLMQGEDSFRGDVPPVLVAKVPVVAGQATWRADIVPGTYAVIAHHDRNSDDTLNRPVFGIPLEPYAFSNGAWTSIGLPPFEAVSFAVDDGVARQKLRLRLNAFAAAGQMIGVGLPALIGIFLILAVTRRFNRRRSAQHH